MAARKKEVTKPTRGELARKHAMEDAGVGQENMTRDDYEIPRILLIQNTHDFTKKNKPDYHPDANEGDFIFLPERRIVSGEAGFDFIPVFYRRTVIEQTEDVGSFVREVGLLWAQEGLEPEKGNVFAPVADYYGLIIEGGTTKQAFLRMKSTQLKKSRRWNTMIAALQVPVDEAEWEAACKKEKITPELGAAPEGYDGEYFNPAMFYRTYHMTSVPEGNDKGDWMGWVIEGGAATFDLPRGEDIYLACRDFRKAVQEGAIQPTNTGEEHDRAPGASEDDDRM